MDQVLNSVLLKLNLTLIEIVRIPDNGSVRSYIAYVNNIHGKAYTIKLFASKDKVARERFIREIRNIKQIRSKINKCYKSWVPTIQYYSTKSNYPYYVYTRIDGDPIGKFVEDYGIKWGIFKHQNFEVFLKFFDTIHSLDIEGEYSSWSARHARKELQYYFENVKRIIPSDLYDKINTFYEHHNDEILKFPVFSHRDLYPENILIQSPASRKFVFLDWEFLSYVPLGYDAAFLYLSFWKEEYWKAKVFAHFYNLYKDDKQKIANFLISFRFCLIILAVRFIYQLNTFGVGDDTMTSNAKLSFIYDLGLALSGEIVKPLSIKFLLEIGDIQKVADEYELGSVNKYEIFYASKGNTVAKVNIKGKAPYIFRFYSLSRTSSLINRELKIFERLKNHDISTYEVIKNNRGELYSEIMFYGKTRRIAVLSFVKGKKIHHDWISAQSIRQAGQMLRKIHDQNIIHGDYSKENVLYIKGKISGVIDFEWGRFTSSKEAKLHDLAKSIALWMVDVRNKSYSDDVLVLSFIEGYYGHALSSRKLVDLCKVIIEKIEFERNIYRTTIDAHTNKHAGKRFDQGVISITDLISSYTI